ncbi:hypothetical protein [Pseudoxanthomonas sp. PXM05]|uniref:hypothetical protein n=1 Tax=Pseudoxanthomonas sp. PXM05 TaxID=2854775 RepID=UPI001C43AE24|nr:hypothetical protein [Pseudoxanthomonas sp. PXM05]MBV7475388.1 hypothetical protein [Pseudoxanthomonas sp. PXM05]
MSHFDGKNDYEEACREWMRGCSNAPAGKPWECAECTAAFHARLLKLTGTPEQQAQWKEEARLRAEWGIFG